MPKAHDEATESVRLALIELRRLFQRKELVAIWEAALGRRPRFEYADVRLLDAVVACRRRDEGVAVGDVARALGIDPSRASREVARAVRAGLLRRQPGQGDGRRVDLAVTARGNALLAKGSELARARIALALRAFTVVERARFASLLGRFVGAMTERRGRRVIDNRGRADEGAVDRP